MVVIKIFDAKDTNFNTAGNIIIEPLYCHEIKKKSLNGWYIDVEIPINYKKYIEQDKLCVVQTKSKLNPQAFRIKDIEYTTNKIVFQAQHVMFDAEDYFLLDSRPTNQNGLNVLNYINGMTDKVSPFTIYSNVENISTAYLIRKNLLEAWSIIEERWGGVFDADNWNISFLTSVGNDKGETIYYGKNLEDMKIIEDWSGVCTKLYPVGKDEVMLADKYLESTTQYDIPYTRTIKFDTQLDDEEQTEENLLNELKTNATNYLQENCVPKVCYEINSNINQDMEIGDIIQVKHPLCNISTEVLEYEYDVILRKIIKLVFGNYSKDVKKKFKAVTNTIESIKETVNKQQATINNQTNLINSLNKNGYVYIDENEILLLDAIPKEKAKNVWRFGLAGIGFSSNGYEGPFEVAITMDGQINANFITTGTMSVSRIEGLANFISETEKQISEIEIEQGNITSRVSSLETTAESLQAQIDGAIQFWNGSEIPTVENYPANEWETEADKNNHRADIYTVIEDVDGELKQGKSYRFDKVGDTWQWIELTDNELSAVQALATSKAKVFVETPTVPYSVGDLWINGGKLYRCKTAKDNNGTYSESDWEEAVDYTDDTVAELAKTLANNAQSTADSAIEGVNNITNTQGEAEGKNIHIEDSAEEPFVDIELNGETSQKTRDGYNLYDIDKALVDDVLYKNSDGSYTLKKNDSGIRFAKEVTCNLSANTPYTCCYELIDTNSTYYRTLQFIAFYTDGTSSTWGMPKTTNKTVLTFSKDVKSLKMYMEGSMPNNTYATFKKLMIIQGDYTSSDVPSYEPYGVMPSPDYPSEIENVEGKNRADINAVTTTNTNNWGVGVNGDTLTIEHKNTYTDGTPKLDLELNAGTYYLSLNENNGISLYVDNVYKTVLYNNSSFIVEDGKKYVLYFGNSQQSTLTYTNLMVSKERGSYVPYNSLEFKVEGKNRFDKSKDFTSSNISKNLWTITQIENGLRVMSNYSGGVPYIRYIITDLSNFVGKTIRAKANFVSSSANKGAYRLSICNADGTNPTEKKFTGESNKEISFIVETLEEGKKFLAFDLYSNFTGGTQSSTAYVDYTDIIITIDDEDMTYEPYKSQVATFPLGGQKLMEGSYLADDGIHHKRKQVVLDGTETWGKDANYDNSTDYFYIYNIGINTNNIDSVICDYFKKGSSNVQGFWATTVFCITINNTATEIVSSDTRNQRIAKWKTWLSQNPITVEYELAEPETVPYTEAQQEARNKIKALMTYKNITNITSDAYAKVVYMRDNGLDVYETKQNAQKRYTETSEKLAEQKMTVDGVITQVSETNKRLTNDYLTAEQVNAELDTTKEDIEIIKQNQVTMTQTSKNLQIAIDTINNEGVTKVKTSMGYTFDDEGFKLNRSNAETGTIIDEAAVQVIDKTGASEQNLLYAGYVKEGNTNYPSYIGQTIVASANMIVQNYLVVPNSRFEEYTNPVLGGKGTGVFEV